MVTSRMLVGFSCRIPFFSPQLVSSPGVAQPLSSIFRPEIDFGSGSPRLIPLECALPRIGAANAVESALTKKGRRPSAARIISRHASRALPQTPWNLHLRNQRLYLQQNVHLQKKEEGAAVFSLSSGASAAGTGAGRLSLFLRSFRLYNARPSREGKVLSRLLPPRAAALSIRR
jgi:hypothetical protein